MKPVYQLEVGQCITPKWVIDSTRVLGWAHARECANVGGGLMPGAELSIVEIMALPGRAPWVRVQLPGRYPPAFLKISGEELSRNFDLVSPPLRAV
jgi:hypothetical protein